MPSGEVTSRTTLLFIYIGIHSRTLQGDGGGNPRHSGTHHGHTFFWIY